MTPERQTQVLRTFIKDWLRRKGMQFNLRGLGNEMKELNEPNQSDDPVTEVEFLELYLGIMKELTAEHFKAVEEKLRHASSREAVTPKRSRRVSGIPGKAFMDGTD